MRRLVKEKLLKFDGTPLFPERRAYTAVYPLSGDETLLYKQVTDYVVEEMNRADRLKAEGEGSRGAMLAAWKARGGIRALDDDFDLDDLPEGEREEFEQEVVDEASAARTIAGLMQEIATLAGLEELARQLRDSGTGRKWEELSQILQHTPEMYDSDGNRRKLIVFSEHRDTLNYLVRKLHGGMPRDQRRKIQEAFIHDKEVLVLVATDAAGEGLWNLVAEDTREGQVFQRLFEKLDEQRTALGDQVFDVLGEAFRGESLRDLLIEAVRYGEQPEVRQKLSSGSGRKWSARRPGSSSRTSSGPSS